MLMLLFAAASLPIPTVPALDSRDYPEDAVRHSREAVVTHDVVVSPAGYPLNCRIVVSGGPEFDALTCNSIMHRARFKPALDDAGKPTYGVLRYRSAWTWRGSPPKQEPLFDFALAIRPIADLKLPQISSVVLTVGPDGRVTDCGPGIARGPAALVKVTCAQAMSLPAFSTLSFDGHPVSSVRSLAIEYRAQ